MKFSSILYALFSLLVIVVAVQTTRTGFSPFADGGARTMAHGFYGPTHK
jgi:hypothetical protein